VQDRYAGDLGDLSKLGLLRALAGGEPRLELALVWCLTAPTPAEARKGDGRHLPDRHARREELRRCDPDLFDRLVKVVRGVRSVAALERAGVLPAGSRYFREEVPLGAARDAWLERALAATRDADLVGLDPDNGLAPPGVARHAQNAVKYVFFEELRGFAERGQSLVVYQHADRRMPFPDRIREKAAEIEGRLGRPVRAVRFRRGTARAYLLAPGPAHEGILEERLSEMLAGPWGRHFEMVG
jgi:hypothetical protein